MEVVQTFGLRKGQEVDVTVNPLNGAVVIRPGVAWIDGGAVTERFRTLADEVLERRAGLLKARAR
jgi:hypothetical protein